MPRPHSARHAECIGLQPQAHPGTQPLHTPAIALATALLNDPTAPSTPCLSPCHCLLHCLGHPATPVLPSLCTPLQGEGMVSPPLCTPTQGGGTHREKGPFLHHGLRISTQGWGNCPYICLGVGRPFCSPVAGGVTVPPQCVGCTVDEKPSIHPMLVSNGLRHHRCTLCCTQG